MGLFSILFCKFMSSEQTGHFYPDINSSSRGSHVIAQHSAMMVFKKGLICLSLSYCHKHCKLCERKSIQHRKNCIQQESSESESPISTQITGHSRQSSLRTTAYLNTLHDQLKASNCEPQTIIYSLFVTMHEFC